MSKKTKKSTIIIDGKEYRVIEYTNKTESNTMFVPQNSSGEIGSGLHLPRTKERTHWDYYKGNQKIEGKKKYVEDNFKMAPMGVINFKEHQVFLIPPNNSIAVLSGKDKPMEFISLEYYNKDKAKYLEKYSVKLGTNDNPQVLELKPS
jgi:hypothetical protein